VRDRITIAALETETAYKLERDPYGPSRARKATPPYPRTSSSRVWEVWEPEGFHSRAGRSVTFTLSADHVLIPPERCAKVPRVELDIEERRKRDAASRCFPSMELIVGVRVCLNCGAR
jgi:hypothetical protein